MSVLKKAVLKTKKEDVIKAILACMTVEEFIKKAQDGGVELPLEEAEELFSVVHKPDFKPEDLKDSELNGCFGDNDTDTDDDPIGNQMDR